MMNLLFFVVVHFNFLGYLFIFSSKQGIIKKNKNYYNSEMSQFGVYNEDCKADIKANISDVHN